MVDPKSNDRYHWKDKENVRHKRYKVEINVKIEVEIGIIHLKTQKCQEYLVAIKNWKTQGTTLL